MWELLVAAQAVNASAAAKTGKALVNRMGVRSYSAKDLRVPAVLSTNRRRSAAPAAVALSIRSFAK